MSYPENPGYKVYGPSKDAAHAVRGRAWSLRDRILAFLRSGHPSGFTGDQIASHFRLLVYEVRPRLAKLHMQHEIEQTGERRLGEAGRPVHCWRAAVA